MKETLLRLVNLTLKSDSEGVGTPENPRPSSQTSPQVREPCCLRPISARIATGPASEAGWGLFFSLGLQVYGLCLRTEGPGVWDAQSRSMVEAAWLQGLLLKFAGGFMLRSSRSVGRVVHIILASLKLDQCLQ